MKHIPLSATYRCRNSGLYVAIVDDEDYDFLKAFAWMANVRRQRGVKYVRARRTDRSSGATRVVDMHRVVWERAHGPVPSGMTIDHIEHGDHGALDNRRSNLRLASRRDQQGNRRASRKWKGTSQCSRTGRWCAFITVHYKSINLGRFNSEREAAQAYDAAALRHFGVFARLNFPSELSA